MRIKWIIYIYNLLSSANKVWEGHRNGGSLSVRPKCERTIFRTVSLIDFKFEI